LVHARFCFDGRPPPPLCQKPPPWSVEVTREAEEDWGAEQPMMTVTQTTRLLAWIIVGLIVLGILLYLFGPAALRTDELIVIGLLIIGLIWFQVWLRRRGE
jgi:F0F1-type ATP synthase assembly protein I